MNVVIVKGSLLETSGKLKQRAAFLTGSEKMFLVGKKDEYLGKMVKQYGKVKDEYFGMLKQYGKMKNEYFGKILKQYGKTKKKLVKAYL
jgi:uncharacterized protein YjbJ (UPF0337 family)